MSKQDKNTQAQQAQAQAQAQVQTQQAQAQQAKESTTLTTTANNNALTQAFTGANVSKLGFTLASFDKDKDGATLVHTADNVGTDVYSPVMLTADEEKAQQALNVLRVAQDTASIMVAWNASQLATVAKDAGFKSIGAYVSAQMDKYEAGTLNKYVRVAKYFLEQDKDGDIVYKRSWCKDVPVSKLAQILALVEKCDGDIDKLYNDYILTRKLSLHHTLSEIKEDMRKIAGKEDESTTGKGKGKGKDGDSNTAGEESILTKWSAVKVALMQEKDVHKLGALKALIDGIDKYFEEQEQEQEQEQENK